MSIDEYVKAISDGKIGFNDVANFVSKLSKEEKHQDASRIVEALNTFSPFNSEVMTLLVGCYANEKRYDEAVKIGKEAYNYSSTTQAHQLDSMLIQVYIIKEDYQEAINTINDIFKEHNHIDSYWFSGGLKRSDLELLRGYARLASGNAKEALDDFYQLLTPSRSISHISKFDATVGAYAIASIITLKQEKSNELLIGNFTGNRLINSYRRILSTSTIGKEYLSVLDSKKLPNPLSALS